MQSRNDENFYTHPEIAARCVASLFKVLDDPHQMMFMEPAAGDGAFSLQLEWNGLRHFSMDIQPKADGIATGDFLSDDMFPQEKPLCVIGNPPFGRVNSLAVKFFNRAAEQAEHIAFILPRSFRKQYVQDKLDLAFWLALDEDLPRKSFLMNGKPHDVPCVWQIWSKRRQRRKTGRTADISHIAEWVRGREDADFAFRRIGGNAGEVLGLADVSSSTSSFFYFRAKRDDAWAIVREAGQNLKQTAKQTVGPKAISKRELAAEIARLDSQREQRPV